MKAARILLTALFGVIVSVASVFAIVAPPPQPYEPVPEPSTLALLGIGLAAGLGYKMLRKKRG